MASTETLTVGGNLQPSHQRQHSGSHHHHRRKNSHRRPLSSTRHRIHRTPSSSSSSSSSACTSSTTFTTPPTSTPSSPTLPKSYLPISPHLVHLTTPPPSPPLLLSSSAATRLTHLHALHSHLTHLHTRWLTYYHHELSLLATPHWSHPTTPSCICDLTPLSTLGPTLPRLDLNSPDELGNIEIAVKIWCERVEDRVRQWGEETVCPLLVCVLQEERRLWRWYKRLGDEERRGLTEGLGCWERFRGRLEEEARRVERRGWGRWAEREAMLVITGVFGIFLAMLGVVWWLDWELENLGDGLR